MSTLRPVPGESADERVLLGIVRGLGTEMYPERADAVARLGLGASLERDFGFDSLGRAELLSRIEHRFGVSLPDAVLGEALTVGDLLTALVEARTGSPGPRPPVATVTPIRPAPRVDRAVAHESATLVEALERHARDTPERVHTSFLNEALAADDLTYGALLEGARAIAAGLWQAGVQPRDSVALMLPSDRTYFETFMGVLLAGATPVPIYPPLRPGQIESHLRRHARILDNAETKVLVTLSEGRLVSRVLAGHVPSLLSVTTPAELRARRAPDASTALAPEPNDTALIQYTSGSTGDPKGVVLTHAQLLANIRAMGDAIAIDDQDVFVSWLPLYHDMGLIGAWLGSSLCFGARLVLMSPVTFLRRPVSWLTALTRHRGTLSAAPNFGYEMAVHRIRDEELGGIDLRRWRLAFNGAEPVSANAMEAFTERYAPLGFSPQAMAPVFGLAECGLGLTFPPLGRAPRVDRISAEAFARQRRALPTDAGTEKVLAIVGCGRPLPGYAVRIVDEVGASRAERCEGRIEFQGPSATRGYYRNPAATAALFDGEWLDTGDLGYLADGELFITRRAKDMIVRAGRNLFPYELEEAVGDVDGLRKGCVAVFGSRDPVSGAERVVVLAERAGRDPPDEAETARLVEAIQTRAVELLGLPADDVVLVPANSVLKTSSGKIRRAACRERYEAGKAGQRSAPVWWQVASVALTSLPGQLRRLVRHATDAARGGWTLAVISLLGALFYPVIVLGPRRAAWPLARAAVRAALVLTGCPLQVHGGEHLAPAAGAAVVLAPNHASYMDWLVAVAALPEDFAFVAKAELARGWLIGPLLRKLDTRFVERFDARQSVADAERVAEAVRRGRSLLVFPEGTLRRTPGLAPFRLGAFQAAVQAQAAVVPIAIRGTRRMLPDGEWVPRPGRLEVTVCPPVRPEGKDWAAAIALRDRVRAAIAEHLDEPLLTFTS